MEVEFSALCTLSLDFRYENSYCCFFVVIMPSLPNLACDSSVLFHYENLVWASFSLLYLGFVGFPESEDWWFFNQLCIIFIH